MYTVKLLSFITALGTKGISPPNVHAEKIKLLGIYAMLTYIFIIFPRNIYHINGFWRHSLAVMENSLAYVNVLRACLLAPLGGCWGSSDEGSYSSSWCLLVDLCFCANSVLRCTCTLSFKVVMFQSSCHLGASLSAHLLSQG